MNKTVTLKNDRLCVEISTFGAEILSVKGGGGGEFMWDGNPDVWSGRAPILFPICGKLRDDKFTYKGKEYKMLQHGFARKKKFSVEHTDEKKAVLALCSDDETRICYPFDFKFQAIFELAENELTVSYRVENKTDGDMFYSVGAHEAYACPEGIENYTLEFEKEECLHGWRIDAEKRVISEHFDNFGECEKILPLKEEMFRNDAAIFRNLNSSSVCLRKNGGGRSIKVFFPEHTHLLLWNKLGARYLCIEPWCGLNDNYDFYGELNEKEGIIHLKKGEERTVRHVITFME